MKLTATMSERPFPETGAGHASAADTKPATLLKQHATAA